MLHTENKARRVLRYAMVAVLMLAFALSFFSCIKATFSYWMPGGIDGIESWVEYQPMLPGCIRYLMIPAAALLLAGQLVTDILSLIFMVLPFVTAWQMDFVYRLLQNAGGLGGYTYEYTLLGRIVTGLLMLVWLSEILLLCTYKKKKQE